MSTPFNFSSFALVASLFPPPPGNKKSREYKIECFFENTHCDPPLDRHPPVRHHSDRVASNQALCRWAVAVLHFKRLSTYYMSSKLKDPLFQHVFYKFNLSVEWQTWGWSACMYWSRKPQTARHTHGERCLSALDYVCALQTKHLLLPARCFSNLGKFQDSWIFI